MKNRRINQEILNSLSQEELKRIFNASNYNFGTTHKIKLLMSNKGFEVHGYYKSNTLRWHHLNTIGLNGESEYLRAEDEIIKILEERRIKKIDMIFS